MNCWIEDSAKEGFIVVIRERSFVVGGRPGSASAKNTFEVPKSRSWIRGMISRRDFTTVVVSTSLERMTIFRTWVETPFLCRERKDMNSGVSVGPHSRERREGIWPRRSRFKMWMSRFNSEPEYGSCLHSRGVFSS